MSPITITTRFPVKDINDQKVAVVVGVGSPTLGEPVVIYEPKTQALHEGYYVTESEIIPAIEVYDSILELYNFPTAHAFVQALSREVGTDLPPEIPITVYVVTKLEDTESWDEQLSIEE